MNIQKFTKENIALCICTLGIAILGYLGYHAVRWIVTKCQKTEKIDQIAQQTIPLPPAEPPKSLENRVTVGQGEYLVFHQMPNGDKKKLTQQTFEQIYKILTQHAPLTLISSGSKEDCANRYALIQAKIKEIDPTLEAVFIPRTLYELVFIRKCIQEDLKHKTICPHLSKKAHQTSIRYFSDEQERQAYIRGLKALRIQRKCWHICRFYDAGDNAHVRVKRIAYRLNNVMLKAFLPMKGGFTQEQLAAFTEKEIVFLQNHHENSEQLKEMIIHWKKQSFSTQGPTINFVMEVGETSVGIRKNETDGKIVRGAVTLECSRTAATSLFLYRGGNYNEDHPVDSSTGMPHSLSYGSSLFAGSVYDAGASAFHHMRKWENKAYALAIPFDEVQNSPFYVPPTNTVAQLFGEGELFHGRSKTWQGFNTNNLGGVDCVNVIKEAADSEPGVLELKLKHLKSDLSQELLIAQYLKYSSNAIQLK